MCGISAYTGKEKALPFLVQGLSRLEYRGYDSAGITVVQDNSLYTYKEKGRLENLQSQLADKNLSGSIGIGHTRWATHGVPSHSNAHPHMNDTKTLSLVHNGIIENYQEIKAMLSSKGYTFSSDTDSEVIVHLLDYYYEGNMILAIQKVTKQLQGSYALCIVSTDRPDTIYITRKDSPIVIGTDNHASFAASDIPAILDYTKEVYFLEDYEIAKLRPTKILFYDRSGNTIEKEKVTIPYDNESAKKDGYDTFMLKEIHDQPKVMKDTLRGRIHNDSVIFEELVGLEEILPNIHTIYFIACGTAYHACMCGAHMLEEMLHMPVHCQVASEFRYNNPLLDAHTLAIFISQSGETADTMAALRLANKQGATTIAIVNAVGSSLSREATYTLYTYAGPEIAVASTKAYTTQLLVLVLLNIYIAQQSGLHNKYKNILQQIKQLPQYITSLLRDHEIFEKYASYLKDKEDVYYIGRGLDYCSVLEGALKLKEVSYIHADAYVAGELKHGAIALIEEGTVVIAAATQPHITAKTISNIQETISRGAHVIAFTVGNEQIRGAKEVYYMPTIDPLLQSILVAIPLQLISYYAAKFKGRDIDKPRNLAKSVTVE